MLKNLALLGLRVVTASCVGDIFRAEGGRCAPDLPMPPMTGCLFAADLDVDEVVAVGCRGVGALVLGVDLAEDEADEESRGVTVVVGATGLALLSTLFLLTPDDDEATGGITFSGCGISTAKFFDAAVGTGDGDLTLVVGTGDGDLTVAVVPTAVHVDVLGSESLKIFANCGFTAVGCCCCCCCANKDVADVLFAVGGMTLVAAGSVLLFVGVGILLDVTAVGVGKLGVELSKPANGSSVPL